ncbi:MAG: hypothetical protein IJN42_07955 [Clostridia bacterium]|nr:hypothetical protein [Clostridia bacterium]
MINIKKRICLLVILLLICCSGCQAQNSGYEYMYAPSSIMSIEIVELTGFDNDTYKFDENVLLEIEDSNSFISKLDQIPYTRRWNPPLTIEVGSIVIKITYDTGNFEYIHSNAQRTYDLKQGIYGIRDRNYCFDQPMFDALISQELK